MMLGDLLGVVLAAAFGGWMLYLVVSGVRAGRIHHTDSTSVFTFRAQPVLFTLVAALFAGTAVLPFCVAALKVVAIRDRLGA
jgi:threonine/homoserine efflux transporter RhtA